MFKLNSVTANWERKCSRRNFRFATIKTTKAIYNRAAVLKVAPDHLIVEYIKKDPKKGYVVRMDKIDKRDLIQMRYYQ